MMVEVAAEIANPAAPALVIKLRKDWSALVYPDWELPSRILQAWETLVDQYGDAGVFLHYGWLQQWWSAFGGGRSLRIFVIERGGKVCGIFPCWSATDSQGKFLLHSMTGEVPYDFLVAPDEPAQTVAAFLETVLKLRPAAATFEGFCSTCANGRIFDAEFHKAPGFVGCYRHAYAPFIDLHTGTFEQYTATLHSRLKRNLRKGRRMAEQAGDLSFEILRRPQSLERLMTELFDLEYRSWKGEQNSAIKCDPAKKRFYRAMARWVMERGCLYIFALRLNGHVIAFDLCIAGGRTIFILKTAYDQSLSAGFSPGNLMRFRAIEYLFQTGQFDRYDFLGACDPWKLEWASQATAWSSLELYPRTLAGCYAWFLKYGWKEPFKRSPMLAAALLRIRSRFEPGRMSRRVSTA